MATTIPTPAAIDARARKTGRGRQGRSGQVVSETYVVERFIGSGAMGEVWEASHRRIHRRFAIKFIQEVRLDEQAVARLRREAEITSRLRHPHIVEVVDFDLTEEGTPYIVMDLLTGEPLSRQLRGGQDKAFDPELFTMVLCQTTSAMQAAHDKGVVHRDLKPSNIFLADDGAGRRVKVLDFGISKLQGATAELTSNNALMGTPRYMPPEMAEGKASEANAQTDIFSMGAILYEMVAGAPPFSAATVPSTLYKVVHHSPEETERWRAAPKPLRTAILGALAKKPEHRPASMRELQLGVLAALRDNGYAQLVERYAPSLGNTREQIAHPPSARQRPPLWRAAALVLPALAIVALASWWLGRDPRTNAQEPVLRAPLKTDGQSSDSGRELSRAPSPVDASSARPAARADASDASPRASRHDATATKRPARRSHALRRRGYGRLTVQSRDRAGAYLWANVWVDGRARGQTTLTLPRLRAGYHRVIVKRRGFRPVSRRVLIRRGKRTLLGVKLRPR